MTAVHPDESPGLRERKKQRTRETIVRVAMDLFAERGYEGTTIHDIAAAADIAPRTFFGYFPSKEAVVFHDVDDTFADFAARLEARAPGESPFDALRAWLLEHAATCEADGDDAVRRCLVEATPTLAACQRASLARFQDALARAVADDLGVAHDTLRPHLVASAAVAAIEAACGHGPAGTRAGGQAAVVLDEAIAFLQGGIDALRRRATDQ